MVDQAVPAAEVVMFVLAAAAVIVTVGGIAVISNDLEPVGWR